MNGKKRKKKVEGSGERGGQRRRKGDKTNDGGVDIEWERGDRDKGSFAQGKQGSAVGT